MDDGLTQEAWGQWVRKHAPRLLLFARQLSRSEADAQDLVQDSLLAAWKRCADGQVPPLSAVFTTIRCRAIDWGRRSDRRTAREESVQESQSQVWFDTHVEDREMSQWVQSALMKLPDYYREVLTLRVWGELTFEQIAEVTGAPPNTVASRYRYGLAELRKLAREVKV
ncbi:MAG TPA: sigma-70 family RNA polymerase sigma factor [Candidatus Paceibacterota bacterium]|nr:sigma-70 family RNA polymerase sigma factor [Verrucomicrobiota bacterium]HRY48158.1 sigma-70 family RNA polymerase sigma factor [Candidatus Paceibacterota bacterium]